MSDDWSGIRSKKRKRKTADKILNISIGVVIFLILLVGGQLLLGGSSSQKVSSDKSQEKENPIVNEEIVEEIEEIFETELEEEKEEENEEKETANPPQPIAEQPNQSTSVQPTNEGKWKPIGTVQPEPFHAVFERDHVNWQEMRRAFQVATGLGDNFTLWDIRNGGNHRSAIGVVADAQTINRPYEVRIEWVTNEGWMPVSVVQLEKNMYLHRSSTYSSNEETEATE